MPGCQFVDFLMGGRIVGKARDEPQRSLIEIEVEGCDIDGVGRKTSAAPGERNDRHASEQHDDGVGYEASPVELSNIRWPSDHGATQS